MSAPTSRLAKYMRARLGDAAWADFVRHANRHHKAAYVRAFGRRELRCVGPQVDLAAPDATETLEFLHLDHERPVHLTCARWAAQLAQLPAAPASWDDGIDGGALCHALFGVGDDAVHGACCVRFRCGPRRGAAGEPVPFAQHAYCHRS